MYMLDISSCLFSHTTCSYHLYPPWGITPCANKSFKLAFNICYFISSQSHRRWRRKKNLLSTWVGSSFFLPNNDFLAFLPSFLPWRWCILNCLNACVGCLPFPPPPTKEVLPSFFLLLPDTNDSCSEWAALDHKMGPQEKKNQLSWREMAVKKRTDFQKVSWAHGALTWWKL